MRRLGDGLGVARRRSRGAVAGQVRELKICRHVTLLQLDVEAEIDRPLGVSHGDLVGSEEGFGHTQGALGLVVPLHVVPDELRLHLRRVDPVDPGPPVGGVQRPGAAENEHRGIIQPGFVNGLAGMLQADDVVHQGDLRPARGQVIALSHGHGYLFVAAGDHFRSRIAPVGHQRFVQPTRRSPWVQGGIVHPQCMQQVHDQVRHVLRFFQAHTGLLCLRLAALPSA